MLITKPLKHKVLVYELKRKYMFRGAKYKWYFKITLFDENIFLKMVPNIYNTCHFICHGIQ